MRNFFPLALLLLLPLGSQAHVNSPDVYYDAYAGPYRLLVTVRPAAVVPGIAHIEIRSADPDVEQIKVLPLPMLAPAGKFAPVPDLAQRAPRDPNIFRSNVWLMERGSWKIQIQVEGRKGAGEVAVPVPAVSTNSARMQKTLRFILAVLGLALVAGLVSIIAAAVREAQLPAGETPGLLQRKRGYTGGAIAAAIVILALLFGNVWWRTEATANASMNYRLPQLAASLHNEVLRLQLQNPNPPPPNRFKVEPPDRIVLNDLVPDHGHLMHLVLVRMPDMTSFWHLHPEQTGEGEFAVKLPSIPAGHYQIYADIVHRTGFPETQVGTIDVFPTRLSSAPASKLPSPSADDAGVAEAVAADRVARLRDGYSMTWERDDSPLPSRKPLWFRFRLEDSSGRPAQDLESYMGMPGHAFFMRTDGKVFAHVHPAGSVPVAAAALAGDSMPSMLQVPESSEIAFPYGFPQAGDYRLFVQVKRAGKVETAVFQAKVD